MHDTSENNVANANRANICKVILVELYVALVWISNSPLNVSLLKDVLSGTLLQ